MRSYSFVHLADQSVLSEYDAIEARENADTATALALLGEIDARRLYVPALVQRVGIPTAGESPIAGIEQGDNQPPSASENPPAPGRVLPCDLLNTQAPMEPNPIPTVMRPRLAPLSAERFGVQFTMNQPMHDRLRYVQSLLGVTVAPGDLAKVFALALECLQDKLERQKFAKCSRPGRRRGSRNARYIPSEIKRAVWNRDGGRCTFVGTGGKRCDARESLEFDHVDPVARGGRATVGGIRLLCRAHNRYAAECTFGTDFMRGKHEGRWIRAADASARA